MAIYKPSNANPLLNTKDIDLSTDNNPLYLECKNETSNSKVNGYAIKILNENNDQVFPINSLGEPVDFNISSLSELYSGSGSLNSGINGSYIRVPFVKETKSDNTVDNNQIYKKSYSDYYTISESNSIYSINANNNENNGG